MLIMIKFIMFYLQFIFLIYLRSIIILINILIGVFFFFL